MLMEAIALTGAEAIIYEAICEAAENGAVCPSYLDLLMLIGCESSSTTPAIVARLERKGYIRVTRYQRFREVQIVATGKWTVRSPAMHSDRPHVPRGSASRGPAPAGGKLAKKARNL